MGSLSLHNVTFVTGHRVLDDVARDMARGLTRPAACRIRIDLGIHLPGKLAEAAPDSPHDLFIGIQTEQLLDETGAALWHHGQKDLICRRVAQYDHVLDLSPLNAPIYQTLPDGPRSRITFGPHIFPHHAPLAVVGQGPLVFFGTQCPRRTEILAGLRQAGIAVNCLNWGKFGEALSGDLENASGILNIHFDNGIYTEYPRLLKALLAGKPVVSERLAAPLVAKTHYWPLEKAEPADLAQCFDAMADLLCTHYSLQSLLDSLVSENQRAKA